MEKIKVKKHELLTILRENRAKHKEDYLRGMKAYRAKCADLLMKELEKAMAGEAFATCVSASKPTSHLKDYDLAIRMFDMGVFEDDLVELNQMEVNQYLGDYWSWKGSFTTVMFANSSYYDVNTITGFSGYSGCSGTSGSSGMSGTSGSSGTAGTANSAYYIVFPDEEIELMAE